MHLDETRSRGAAEARPRYSRGTAEVQPRYGRGTAEVHVVSHLVGDEGLGIAQDLGVELDVAYSAHTRRSRQESGPRVPAGSSSALPGA